MHRLPRSVDPAANFWAELAPCDHVVQIYDSNAEFLDELATFVGRGLSAGEGVIVIATQPTRYGLYARLKVAGLDLEATALDDQLITLDAVETLAGFMVGAWPDEALFTDSIARLLKRAGCDRRRIRAFGEMVALLWAQGQCGATVRLEYLWQRFCLDTNLSLLCAYPKSGFTTDASASLRQICEAHSHVAGRTHSPRFELSQASRE